MDGPGLLQVAATALLNGGFAWLTGSLLARVWLAARLPLFEDRLRRAELSAAFACLLGGAGVLLAAAARMGDSGLADALPMWWPVTIGTDFGRATLLAVAAVLCTRMWNFRVVSAGGLLVFVLARASVSHGGEGGLPSAGWVVEVIHLLLIGVWIGGVALAAWLVLPAARRLAVRMDDYLDRLSWTATMALAGVIATGAWNSWHRLSAPSDLWQVGYGILLGIKLALFLIAVLLGGWNRLFGFPRAKAAALDAVLRVLRIESAVLVGALIAAAALIAQPPPA